MGDEAASVGAAFADHYPIIEHPIPRNKVADLFAKDFELPRYDPVSQKLAREQKGTEPPLAATALGDAAGAIAAVDSTCRVKRSWRASAFGALGDIGGAKFGQVMTEAARAKPLPRDYSGLEVPIPIIATDPNAGVTVGIMPVSVFREGDRITNIFAPQITYNQIQGEGALFRMRRYFTVDSGLSIDAGSTTKGEHDYDVIYNQAHFGPFDVLLFRGRLRYITELEDRFFGLGSRSSPENESNYTFHRGEGDVGLGAQLPVFPLRVMFDELLSTNSVGPGHVSGVESTTQEFPLVRGVHDRIDLYSHRVTLTLDTRDQLRATNNGLLAEFYYEIADATLLSDVSFTKIGFSISGVLSYWEDRLATAGRFGARWVSGKNVPFYELTSVGGRTTLRGYPDGRFVGKNGIVAGIEERWNVVGFNLHDTDLRLQVAGFGEMGQVFGGHDQISFEAMKFSTGGAVRLVIPKSDIVVSLDLGVSKEGEQTFLTLDYPF
jgi:hypothetical protein